MWDLIESALGPDAAAILAVSVAVVGLVARVFWMVRRG